MLEPQFLKCIVEINMKKFHNIFGFVAAVLFFFCVFLYERAPYYKSELNPIAVYIYNPGPRHVDLLTALVFYGMYISVVLVFIAALIRHLKRDS